MSVVKSCIRCDRTFTVPQCQSSAKYCSYECRKNRVIITCKVCAQSFEAKASSGRKYCSSRCAQLDAQQRIPRTCEYCGKYFEVTPKTLAKGTTIGRFCSHKCHGATRENRVTLTCEHCNVQFQTTPCHINKRFCSAKCMGLAKRTAPVVTATCEHCNKTYQQTVYRINRGRFCSPECANTFMRGERSPHWRGGKNWYRGPNWQKTSNQIRKRDNNVCQRCGTPGGETKFDVHHIIPWRVSQDNSPSNLVTMCPQCHKIAEYEYWRDNPVAQLRLDIR